MDASELFYHGLSLTVHLADVSEFNEDEVKCVSPLNPVAVAALEQGKWDGKLQDKKPINGDFGINKKKEIFCYVRNEWKPIN